MLTIAALGMGCYGAFEVFTGGMDLISTHRLEVWAALALMLFGVVLIVGAGLVRVSFPGGLALSLGALLSLQALALHNAVHQYETPTLMPHLLRAALALVLVALAHVGGRAASTIS